MAAVIYVAPDGGENLPYLDKASISEGDKDSLADTQDKTLPSVNVPHLDSFSN